MAKSIKGQKDSEQSAEGSSILSSAFSSARFGSALIGVGAPASVPLRAVAGAFGLISTGLITASK